MKRVMISFLALVLAAGFLAGCSGGKGASPGPQDSKKKVTLLHYFSGTLSGGVQDHARGQRNNECKRTLHLSQKLLRNSCVAVRAEARMRACAS